jgi:hypothetical protein
MRTGVLILVAVVAASLSGAAPTARAADAPAILQPAAGAIVSSPVTVIVAPESAAEKTGAMPATGQGMGQGSGMKMTPGSHLHLLVDSALPKPGSMIPMDAHHVHLMHGETKVTLRLPAGSHTLQLVRGTNGHQVPKNPQVSPVVTFSVQ